jgi:hypothetical protein
MIIDDRENFLAVLMGMPGGFAIIISLSSITGVFLLLNISRQVQRYLRALKVAVSVSNISIPSESSTERSLPYACDSNYRANQHMLRRGRIPLVKCCRLANPTAYATNKTTVNHLPVIHPLSNQHPPHPFLQAPW